MESGIIYCPYIPIQRNATLEEYLEDKKRERAGKTYGKVKRSNPSATYSCKVGEIVATDNDRYCLYIDVLNTTSTSGCQTLLGVMKGGDGYQKVWFRKDELENIINYDAEGNEIQ